ncbi:MAG: HlyD family efflux transporter periplasmic adaptor subunit [Chloroflexi bacterium]|nr:HlyD family efflux transporter periplasmic adaptor subunit [Chloroflexota bacterium]
MERADNPIMLPLLRTKPSAAHQPRGAERILLHQQHNQRLKKHFSTPSLRLLPFPSVELAFAQGGIVDEILVQPGERVNKGDVIARLVGIESIQAEFAIGDSASVKLDAFPNEAFTGTVTEIDPVGREYLGDMTYKVTINLDESDPRFLWNMTATVNINIK